MSNLGPVGICSTLFLLAYLRSVFFYRALPYQLILII